MPELLDMITELQTEVGVLRAVVNAFGNEFVDYGYKAAVEAINHQPGNYMGLFNAIQNSAFAIEKKVEGMNEWTTPRE